MLVLILKQQAVVNNPDSLGEVRTTQSLDIPANGRMLVYERTWLRPVCQCMIVCADGVSHLLKGLVVTPSLNFIAPGKSRAKVPVEVVNHSLQVVTIPAKAKVCELYSNEDVVGLDQGVTETEQDDQPKFLANFGHLKDNLSSSHVQEVRALLLKWKSIFSLHDLDLGFTDKAVHHIRFYANIPFKEKMRPVPPSMFEEVHAHLKEMETLGVIRKSQSPYSSNVVIVRKKSGALRFCIDLRQINRKTVPDRYRLARIDSTLDVLTGAKYFSVLDLNSGYWQCFGNVSGCHSA